MSTLAIEKSHQPLDELMAQWYVVPKEADYYGYFAPLARKENLDLFNRDPLALLEATAYLVYTTAKIGSAVSFSDTGEISLRDWKKYQTVNILETLCGGAEKVKIIKQAIHGLGVPNPRNRDEFIRTIDRLRRIGGIFREAADISFYRFLAFLGDYEGDLDLIPIIGQFNQIFGVLKLPENMREIWFAQRFFTQKPEMEIAKILNFTPLQDDPSLMIAEGTILYDLAYSIMTNPQPIQSRLPHEKWLALQELLSAFKTGSMRLMEIVAKSSYQFPDSDSEQRINMLFDLCPSLPFDYENTLKEYDAAQKHDEEMIGECLALARKANEEKAEEPIACIIENAKTGETIKIDRNRKNDAGAYIHAETLALDEAVRKWGEEDIPCWRMYCSVQPCPGCTGLILQRFPHMQSLTFAAYSEPGKISDTMLQVPEFRQAIRQDGVPEGNLQVHDGVGKEEAIEFYRNEVGTAEEGKKGWKGMIPEYDPVKPTYWQRKFTELLFGKA
ncbi:hypothetical protein FJY90_06285 [Candidatus Gottesmanbacteria bacterium]|nr:hypothetical protein [Candidatus Gottesmanbacteria bacterium]